MGEGLQEALTRVRSELDSEVIKLVGFNYRNKGGRELSLVVTKLQEARLWAGEALKEMGYYSTADNTNDTTQPLK